MFRPVPSPEESVSCNVVPLLDVMFLLLIFLMLGSDMSVRETAKVELPVASMAQESPAQRADRFVTLNVVRRGADGWAYSMQGREFDADSLSDRLAAVGSDALEPTETAGRRLSSVVLSIRCDRAAPYEFVQTALASCAAAGIHKTEVAAARTSAD